MRIPIAIFCLVVAVWSGNAQKLVWSDEFDRAGLPDSSKWDYDVGGWGWGNRELEFYTKGRLQNSSVENGVLKITVRQEDTTWIGSQSDITTNHFTSARLVTRGKASWTYGRFEARMKMPKGRGMWPALWLTPTLPNVYGDWPKSGEIDILENFGVDPAAMRGSLQTTNHHGSTSLTDQALIQYPSDSFHVYAAEWKPGSITISVDSQPFFRYANPGTGTDDWPFDQPLYLVLDVAVTGSWGDTTQTQTSTLPQSLQIDWVRVWQDSAMSASCCTLSVAQTPGGTTRVDPVKSSYRPGESIFIQAIADNGYSFSRWNAGPGTLRWSDTLVMDANTQLSALFKPSTECLSNGGFELDWNGWRLWNDSTLHPIYQLKNGEGCVRPDTIDLQAWHVQIANGNFAATTGEQFQISFVAHAASPHPVNFRLSQAHDPFGAISLPTQLMVGTSRQRQIALVNATNSDISTRVELNLALDSNEICFDSVSVKRLTDQATTSAFQSESDPFLMHIRLVGRNLFLDEAKPVRWRIRTPAGAMTASGTSRGGIHEPITSLGSGMSLLEIETSDGFRQTVKVVAP